MIVFARDRQPLEGRRRPGDPEPEPDARPRRGRGDLVSAASARRRRSSARAGSSRPTGVEELDPDAPGARVSGRRRRLRAQGRRRDRRRRWSSATREPRSRSALLLTRNAAAAAPIRVCRDECDAGAIARRGRQLRQRQRRHRRAGLSPTRWRCSDAAAEALGVEPRTVAVAETGVIGVPLRIDGGARRASAAAADGAPSRRRTRLHRGDHDHRPRPEALHGAAPAA